MGNPYISMVRIRKKVIGTQTYYYLEHAVRQEGKVKKKERYLGKKLPKNIETLKRDFLLEIYKEKWYPSFDRIRRNYNEEISLMPPTAKEKALKIFSIAFTYGTNRIEGSKLALRETADLLEKGITPKAKPLNDVKEAEAHEKVFYDMRDYKKDLSLQMIKSLHLQEYYFLEKNLSNLFHTQRLSRRTFPVPIFLFRPRIKRILREKFRIYLILH